MDQVSQDNELQRAIDDITKNAGGEQGDVAADLEQQIQNQMGTPPVPPMPAEGEVPAEMPEMVTPEVPEAPAPEMPGEMPMPEMADAPAADVSVDAPVDAGVPAEVTVDETVATPVEPLTDAPTEAAEVAAEPVVETETATVELSDMGGNDISSVKEAMLRDLFPIMDKVDMGAEEKFELYKTMLDDTNDKTLISGAYEVVKGIADESQRAEALLFLIKKADA